MGEIVNDVAFAHRERGLTTSPFTKHEGDVDLVGGVDQHPVSFVPAERETIGLVPWNGRCTGIMGHQDADGGAFRPVEFAVPDLESPKVIG
jgi:hypothetical protein